MSNNEDSKKETEKDIFYEKLEEQDKNSQLLCEIKTKLTEYCTENTIELCHFLSYDAIDTYVKFLNTI